MRTTGQHRRILTVEFDYSDFPSGVFTPVFYLPNEAKMLGGSLEIRVASNAGTTDTIAFGIVGTPGRNLAATTAKTVGSTALTATTSVSGETLGITRTVTGAAPTAGKGFLYVECMGPGIHDFMLGDLPDKRELNGSSNL